MLSNFFMTAKERMFNQVVSGLHSYASENGFSKVVLGLSGGIDSSVVASIAAKALGKENVLAVSMPSKFTSKESVEDAQVVAKNLGIEFKEWPIEQAVELHRNSYEKVFGEKLSGIADENSQSRIRMLVLMAISNSQCRLLLATGNKTELYLGYCTLYGDLAGGLAPIADLNKLQVYELADHINKVMGNPISSRVIGRVPSAELAVGQVDPFDYNKVAPLVDLIVDENKQDTELLKLGFEKKLIERIRALIKKSEFKRAMAPPLIKAK